MSNIFNIEAIDKTFTSFKVGTKVNAQVVAELKEGILLNIGGKKDGLIRFSEEENNAIKDVKVGDSFEVIITNTKDESGCIIVSKAKADEIITGNAIVSSLNIGDTVQLIIVSTNKFGICSKIGNFDVFIPFSQISSKRVDKNLDNYINKQFNAFVLEIDLTNKKIIASIKAYEDNDQQIKEQAFWLAIFENKVVKGEVIRFTDFGAFVNVDGIDCLVHNNEVSYDKSKKASDELELNKTYEFKVIKCDKENKKVSLSYKALQVNPLTEKVKKLKIGDVVEGVVKKILSFGAIIELEDNVEGLLHVKEASHFYVKNIYEVAKVGQKLTLKIVDIDYENNKVSLSLKAMQEAPDVIKLTEDITQNTKND